MSTRERNKVQCNCKACDGKLVDGRTRNKHDELERNLASSISGFVPSLPLSRDSSSNLEAANIRYKTDAKGSLRKIRMAGQESILLDDNYYEPILADLDQYLSLKKRRRQDSFQEVDAVLEGNNDDFSSTRPIDEDEANGDDYEKDDDDENKEDDNEEEKDNEDDDSNDDNNKEEKDDDGNDVSYEQFDASNITFDCADSWIVL